MADIIEFLSIVRWPGALVTAVAIWFAGYVIVKCYGRRN